MRVLIFGNSSSGKSTLARDVAAAHPAGHLDLDTLAWQPTDPPQRAPLEESLRAIHGFTREHGAWVVEGCYADLLECLVDEAGAMIFMDLSVEACIENARARPWEPHKYPSKTAQDRNLEMLIAWIGDYARREDEFSRHAHLRLFENFEGPRLRLTSNDHAAAVQAFLQERAAT